MVGARSSCLIQLHRSPLLPIVHASKSNFRSQNIRLRSERDVWREEFVLDIRESYCPIFAGVVAHPVIRGCCVLYPVEMFPPHQQ